MGSFSCNYLEINPFLVAGFLMTGIFELICYAVGLTQMQWHKFVPTLGVGIAVSTPPIVALGQQSFFIANTLKINYRELLN